MPEQFCSPEVSQGNGENTYLLKWGKMARKFGQYLLLNSQQIIEKVINMKFLKCDNIIWKSGQCPSPNILQNIFPKIWQKEIWQYLSV